MKKLLLALALVLFSSPAWAQCVGMFQPGTICGNSSVAPAPPRMDTPGNYAPTTPSATRATLPSTIIPNTVNQIVLTGYRTAGDLGNGCTYSSVGATSTGLMAVQSGGGTFWNLVFPNNIVNVGCFGPTVDWSSSFDTSGTKITSGDIAANPQWRGTYSVGQTWDYVATQEAVYAAVAPCSTPGSIQWNVAVFCNIVNRELYIPAGQVGKFYGVNTSVLFVAKGYTIRTAGRFVTTYEWVGSSPGSVWTFNSGLYGLVENFSADCEEFQNFGSAVPCVVLDHNASPSAALTQQVTFVNLYITVGQNGQAMAINPVSGSSGQGDTVNFINPFFGGDFISSDFALWVNGGNTIQIGIFGGDVQGFVHDAYKIGGGSLVAYNNHSENQNTCGAQVCYFASSGVATPILTQFTTYGADFDILGQSNGSGFTLIDDFRAEDNILSNSGGNSYLNILAGVSINNASAVALDIVNWVSGTSAFPGTVVSGGTKGRVFMLVDAGGTPWRPITGGSGTNVIQDSTASFTVNQWAGFDVGIRFGSNGSTRKCGIVSNTATSITFNPACGANPLSSQNMYQVLGLTGGPTPNWDSVSQGSQAPFQGVGQGLTTTASSNCIGTAAGFISSAHVNDWVVIPDADRLSPAGSSIYRMPLYAKITGINTGACNGGSNIVVNRAAAASITNGPGYVGTPITDGNMSWINLAYDTVQGAQIATNVQLGNGMIGSTSFAAGLTSSLLGNFIDPNFAVAGGLAGGQRMGIVNQATHDIPCATLAPAATVDISISLRSCNVLTLQSPLATTTINAPVPVDAPAVSSQEFTLFFTRNTDAVITFGTNFAATGPLYIAAGFGTNYQIKFRNYNGVWQEIGRWPAASAKAVMASTLYSAAGTPLPACGTAVPSGTSAVVSDATAPTYNATYTSGGTVTVPVFCAGSTWLTH